jgi:hypothetical protein
MKIQFLSALGLFGAVALAPAQSIPNPSFEAASSS